MKDDKIQQLLKVYESKMPKGVVLVKKKERFDEVKQAIQDISDLAWDCDESTVIDVYPDDLTGSAVCVKMIANLLVIDMLDKFCEALKKADTFEVYPRDDGYVGIGITFQDVFDAAPPIKKK